MPAFEDTAIIVRHPDRTITNYAGTWQGQFSNVPDLVRQATPAAWLRAPSDVLFAEDDVFKQGRFTGIFDALTPATITPPDDNGVPTQSEYQPAHTVHALDVTPDLLPIACCQVKDLSSLVRGGRLAAGSLPREERFRRPPDKGDTEPVEGGVVFHIVTGRGDTQDTVLSLSKGIAGNCQRLP